MIIKHYSLFILFILFIPNIIFAKKIEEAGDVGQYIVPVSAFVYSLAINDQEGIRQLAKMGIVSMSTVYTLKFSINRKRPKNGNFSFPSGHTASAFWGAAFLHRRHGLSPGLPALLGAAFVGYSRVHAKQHYTSDVLASAAIAYTTSYFIVDPYCATPFVNQDGVGVCLEGSF